MKQGHVQQQLRLTPTTICPYSRALCLHHERRDYYDRCSWFVKAVIKPCQTTNILQSRSTPAASWTVAKGSRTSNTFYGITASSTHSLTALSIPYTRVCSALRSRKCQLISKRRLQLRGLQQRTVCLPVQVPCAWLWKWLSASSGSRRSAPC